MAHSGGQWSGAPSLPQPPGYQAAPPFHGGAPLPFLSQDYYPSSSKSAASPYLLAGGAMPAAAAAVGTYSQQTFPLIGGIAFQPASDTYSYGAKGSDSSIRTSGTLNEKVRRVTDGGTAIDSVKVCTVCNIVCNSEKVFAMHLAGEKHKMKALGGPCNGSSWQGSRLMRTSKKLNNAAQQRSMKKALAGSLKIVKSVYCEVCKIECNSQVAFNTHEFGRKHKAKLEKLQESPKKLSNVLGSEDSKDLEKTKGPSDGLEMKKSLEVQAVLEMKKQKLLDGGVAADEVRACMLCDIVCNSEVVFQNHLAGQKHNSMLKKQEGSGTPQTVHCDICNIECNSQDVLENHKKGKKHKAKEQRVKDSLMSAFESEPNGREIEVLIVEVPRKNLQKQKPLEAPLDVETMKKKLIEGGVAADALRVCSLCNIVCNSGSVFSNHIAGQMHTGMLKKQEASVAVQSLCCDVCNIEFTSQEVLQNHKNGKKHKARGKQLHDVPMPVSESESDGTNTDDLMTAEVASKKSEKTKRLGPQVDVEAMKKKLIEAGVAADELKVCNLCNIVCNSGSVFSNHIAGKRHTSMLKRQEVAGSSTT